MKKANQGKTSVAPQSYQSLTLSDFAIQVIEEQFRRIVKQEDRVLDDQDPEHLHQMRVSTRRLRTALQIFDGILQLPASASAKHLRNLARTLGAVRDLDVQMDSLQTEYQPQLSQREQKKLSKLIKRLHDRRSDALDYMQVALTKKSYSKLKKAYKTWLKHPCFTTVAELPAVAMLPDLISPLLAKLLLHPAWTIATEEISDQNSAVIHDLRKDCKHVRYQMEFFTPFYGEPFHQWIDDVKRLQEQLGAFQDTQVLHDLLIDELGSIDHLPGLQQMIEHRRADALTNWNTTRQNYLNPEFRYHLHQIILQPNYQSTDRSNSHLDHPVTDQTNHPADAHQPHPVENGIVN